MNKRKILIVEDEATIAMDLKVRLTKMGYHVTAMAMNYAEALDELKQNQPDLVLIDVNLEEDKSGIDVACHIHDEYQLPVIFLTAFGDPETFRSALISRPFGFLTKPFRDTDLHHTIELAFSNHETRQTVAEQNPTINAGHLFVKDGSKLFRINIAEITWIQALDNYSEVHTTDGRKQIVNAYLGTLEKKLPSTQFIRIHRSYMVAIDKIRKIEDDYVHLDQKYLPVSKSFKQDLMKRLNII